LGSLEQGRKLLTEYVTIKFSRKTQHME